MEYFAYYTAFHFVAIEKPLFTSLFRQCFHIKFICWQSAIKFVGFSFTLIGVVLFFVFYAYVIKKFLISGGMYIVYQFSLWPQFFLYHLTNMSSKVILNISLIVKILNVGIFKVIQRKSIWEIQYCGKQILIYFACKLKQPHFRW